MGVSEGGGIFKKNDKKMTKTVPKRPPSPAKADVLHEKKCRFLLKKSTQPRKKLKFCLKKCKKNDQKIDPKNHPAPQKPEVLHEKLKTLLC